MNEKKTADFPAFFFSTPSNLPISQILNKIFQNVSLEILRKRKNPASESARPYKSFELAKIEPFSGKLSPSIRQDPFNLGKQEDFIV